MRIGRKIVSKLHLALNRLEQGAEGIESDGYVWNLAGEAVLDEIDYHRTSSVVMARVGRTPFSTSMCVVDSIAEVSPTAFRRISIGKLAINGCSKKACIAQ